MATRKPVTEGIDIETKFRKLAAQVEFGLLEMQESLIGDELSAREKVDLIIAIEQTLRETRKTFEVARHRFLTILDDGCTPTY
jgi:hypothetical protein